jgi:RecB family endonuclease NucS
LEGKKGAQAFEFHIGGYNGVQATAKTFSYSTDADQEIKINIDPLAFLNQIDLTTTHSLMIPGAEAALLTDNYQNMISIE